MRTLWLVSLKTCFIKLCDIVSIQSVFCRAEK